MVKRSLPKSYQCGGLHLAPECPFINAEYRVCNKSYTLLRFEKQNAYHETINGRTAAKEPEGEGSKEKVILPQNLSSSDRLSDSVVRKLKH